MDRRLWLAMVISFFLIFLYQSWVVKKRFKHPPAMPPRVVEKKAEPEESKIAVKPEETEIPLQFQKEPEEIKVEHPLYTAVFTTENAGLKSFQLKKYRRELEENSPFVELINVADSRSPLTVALEGNFELPGRIIYNADRKSLAVHGSDSITFSYEAENVFRIEKEYRFFDNSYMIELNVRIKNIGKTPLEYRFSILWDHAMSKEHRSRYHQINPILLINDSEKREVLKEGEEKEFRGNINWFGMDMHYFLSALVPDKKEGLWVQFKFKNNQYTIAGNYEPMVIPPSASMDYNFKLFAGPKEISILEKAGYKLDRAINLGWFHSIGYPLLIVLKWLYGLIPNYGVAIILLTIIVRIIFFPLSISSYRSMKKLQIIQPELKEIQKKYANDREKLSREMWELYRRHKVNPFGGCLPMLIQIPVFIALYQVLMNAIELRHAPFVLWMKDLSVPDMLFYIPLFSHQFPLRVLPILMGLSMYIQQKITPMAGDPQQVKIMMWMPAILTVMLYGLPSGLTLYWTVSNLLSIIQQLYINKKVKV